MDLRDRGSTPPGKARRTTGGRGRIALPLAYLAALALAVAPVLATRQLPLFDYPNHLARMHILLANGGSAILNQFYVIRWQALPNLAMDAVVPLLALAMPLDWAGKGFIAVTFALLTGGVMLLHRALTQRWSPWPLLAFLFLYSRVFLWGFLNFLFGIGLCLVALAAWIGLRDRSPRAAIALSTLFALLLYLAHLFACGGYALIVGAYELGRVRAERLPMPIAARRIALALFPFVLPAALFLLTPGGAGGRIDYPRFVRKFDLFFTLFNDYNLALDAVSFALVLALFVAGLATRKIVVHRDMRLPLLAVTAAHFALPSTIFTATAVDHRTPVLLAFLLVASIEIRLAAPRTAAALAGALGVLFLARIALVEWRWREADLVYAADRAVLAELPKGSRLAVASPAALVNIDRVTPPLAHFPLLAIIDRDAFVPTLFAYPTQQPVALTAEYRRLADGVTPEELWSVFVMGDPAARERVLTGLAGYDFVVFVDRAPFQLVSRSGLEEVRSAPSFQLFRVTR